MCDPGVELRVGVGDTLLVANRFAEEKQVGGFHQVDVGVADGDGVAVDGGQSCDDVRADFGQEIIGEFAVISREHRAQRQAGEFDGVFVFAHSALVLGPGDFAVDRRSGVHFLFVESLECDGRGGAGAAPEREKIAGVKRQLACRLVRFGEFRFEGVAAVFDVAAEDGGSAGADRGGMTKKQDTRNRQILKYQNSMTANGQCGHEHGLAEVWTLVLRSLVIVCFLYLVSW